MPLLPNPISAHSAALGGRLWGAFRLSSVWLLAVEFGERRNQLFNILWALVFGFATLNILGLVARRFEPERNRWSVGETLAVLVVIASVVLLGWEMLTVFKIFPIRLHSR
jgi:uncharacterized membrane protein YqjE